MAALTVLGAIYFAPLIVALMRGHRQVGAIAALNTLLGWTVIGWVGALVWALTSDVARSAVDRSVAEAATRACPYCAETIKREARVCRYCTRDLEPLPAVNPFEHLPSYSDPTTPKRPKPLSFE